MKVLVVEDDPVIALGLEQKLTDLEYLVAGRASTGRQAVERALGLRPDAILMDLVLPDFNGLEAARRISAGGLQVPVVAVTAHEDPSLVEQAISVGVSAYLIKPVSRAQLRSALLLAMSRQAEFMALRGENADLRQALETRKLIERAKGVLMDQGHLGEAEAFTAIQRRARGSGRTMGDVAAQIVRASEALLEALTPGAGTTRHPSTGQSGSDQHKPQPGPGAGG
jgi:AmiR/NasT family two-component response regulator